MCEKDVRAQRPTGQVKSSQVESGGEATGVNQTNESKGPPFVLPAAPFLSVFPLLAIFSLFLVVGLRFNKPKKAHIRDKPRAHRTCTTHV